MRELIIADSQDIVVAGLKYITASLGNVISTSTHVKYKSELVKSLSVKPDSLVILDYVLLDFSDVNELLIIRSRFPESDWIIFSEDLSDNFLKQTVYHEPDFSILLKNCSEDEILVALFSITKKQRFICNEIANHLISLSHNREKTENNLTSTERDILKEIANGKTTKEIAFNRNISIHTVVSHRKNIFRKLEVNNVYEATKYALKAGIVDVSDYYI